MSSPNLVLFYGIALNIMILNEYRKQIRPNFKRIRGPKKQTKLKGDVAQTKQLLFT